MQLPFYLSLLLRSVTSSLCPFLARNSLVRPYRYIQYTYTHTYVFLLLTSSLFFYLSFSPRRIHAHIRPFRIPRNLSLECSLLFARFVCLSVWPSLRDESLFEAWLRSTRDFNSHAIRTGLSRVKGRRSTSGTRQTRESTALLERRSKVDTNIRSSLAQVFSFSFPGLLR